MSFVATMVRDLLLFVVVMFALFIGLIVVVSVLPNDNPLKGLLSAFCTRLGVTLGISAVGVPVEFVPGIDALYDVASFIFLVFFWGSFVRDVVRQLSSPAQPPRNVIER